MFKKKTILSKTFQVGSCTLISRIFGIIREILTMRYLGASALSDAFFTAYKIPNSLRKIFAEGALSAAFVPSLAATIHEQGRTSANGLMTLAFLVFEGLVCALCVLGIIFAPAIIGCIAPGFSPEMVTTSAECLRIVMPFIFFISSSALFAGALQSTGKFFVPAVSPVILNIVFVSTLLLCIYKNFPVTYLCWGILLGGFLQFLLHVVAYIRARFGFAHITRNDITQFWPILLKFFLCLPSVSVMELSLFIDTSFASYLPEGSISLVRLANRFVGIPLGVFAVAFSTVLLPHFSRVARYAPKRLSFYILEGSKLVFWISLPVTVLMWFFAENIFETLFLSGSKFTMVHVAQATYVLRAFLIGLFFFSLNKVILNIYYALNVAWVPAIISSIAAIVNIVLDWVFINSLQSVGLAFATTCSAIVRTILFLVILHFGYKQRIYVGNIFIFIIRYTAQVALFFVPFYGLYYSMSFLIKQFMLNPLAWFCLHSFGFWLWVGPLALCYMGALWVCRKRFYIRLYFLE